MADCSPSFWAWIGPNLYTGVQIVPNLVSDRMAADNLTQKWLEFAREYGGMEEKDAGVNKELGPLVAATGELEVVAEGLPRIVLPKPEATGD